MNSPFVEASSPTQSNRRVWAHPEWDASRQRSTIGHLYDSVRAYDPLVALTGVPPANFMREGNPEDPRSQRSRRLLLRTFEEEMRRGHRQITVAELVRTAGVSRSTFYSHFADIDDVGVAALRDILIKFDTPSGGSTTVAEPTASMRELISHLQAHRSLCRALLGSEGGGAHPAAGELRAILVDHFEASMNALPTPPPVDARSCARYVVGGVMALVEVWLVDVSSSPAALAEALAQLLPDWLRDGTGLERPLRITD